MRIALNVIAVVLFLVGALWVLQGSNVVQGSVMSGQGQWLWIGIAVVIVSLALAVWANRPRP